MHDMYVWGLTFEGNNELIKEEVLLLSILIQIVITVMVTFGKLLKLIIRNSIIKSQLRNKFRCFVGIIGPLRQSTK